MKWAIQNNTNWEEFQKCINEEFSRNKLPVNSNNINIMWEPQKTKINKTATNAIGMKKKIKNSKKNIWDNDLDGLIKPRKTASRRMIKLENMTVNWANY